MESEVKNLGTVQGLDKTMSLVDFNKMRDAVKAEFMGPEFGGNFRKFAKKRDHERLLMLKEILFFGSTSAQERWDEKKGHHQMYGEMIRELQAEKNKESFKALGLKKNPQFIYHKVLKRWLTADENRKVNLRIGGLA